MRSITRVATVPGLWLALHSTALHSTALHSTALHSTALVALRRLPHFTGAVAWMAAGGTVSMQPQVSGLPGGSVLQSITNGIGAWALVAALVGLIVGAAAWALGSHSQNFQQSYVGKRTVLVSGLAALLIGAAPGIINFFFQAGSKVH
ncbi:MAG: DUF6112 family protein [Acidimicrobiales bacterium]